MTDTESIELNKFKSVQPIIKAKDEIGYGQLNKVSDNQLGTNVNCSRHSSINFLLPKLQFESTSNSNSNNSSLHQNPVNPTLEQEQSHATSTTTSHIKSCKMTKAGIDRLSFGLERLPIFKVVTQWKLSDLLLVFILLFLYFITYDLKPFQRQFYVNDLTISHPFAEVETVNNTFLFIYSMLLPLGIILVLSLSITPMKYKLQATYLSVIGLLISGFLTSLVTDILKNWIGRLRPDFLARCIPAKDTALDTMVFALDVCTTDNMGRLLDGFRTTPSGHSSLSFAGLGYLSFWLSGQLMIQNYNVGAWRAIISWTPTLGATIIALSRTEDYRHHFIDVILGSILGFGIAYWSYRRLFPDLNDDKCYLPYELLGSEIAQEDNGIPQPYDRLHEGDYSI